MTTEADNSIKQSQISKQMNAAAPQTAKAGKRVQSPLGFSDWSKMAGDVLADKS